MAKNILWFQEISLNDVSRVGGKNASLGEMYRELVPKGVRVPNGFAITADAYRLFIQFNRLENIITDTLHGLNTHDFENLRARGKRVREAITMAKMPPELELEIREAYHALCTGLKNVLDVAVRSSATAEDLPDASFAGQQETFLNVSGDEMLIDACKRCFASLFTDRALSYREDKGYGHFEIALSIGVQKMVRSDLATSGVMFTIDTETGFRDVVVINASYGLGENIVQGSVNPDEFCVFKPTLHTGFRPIVQKRLGVKEMKMVYGEVEGEITKNIPVVSEDRQRFSISDEEVLTLARWGCIVENHYSQKSGRDTPMDLEWAKDGRTNELFIVQARPETVESQKLKARGNSIETYRLLGEGKVLIEGRSVGSKIATGPVRVIENVNDLGKLMPGEILVTDKTDPDWEPAMKKAAAIITNRGGRTCHAAIVSRELGLPAIVGCETATEVLKDGQKVTVNCAGGETGYVYDGALDFNIDRVALNDIPQTRTKIMMNVANPEEAFRLSFIPNRGVGLARVEFIISNWIQIHPLALFNFQDLKDEKLRSEIKRRTAGYSDKKTYFVERLAQGVATIAAAFYPKDVIVRFSDFKSNEYANLLGGSSFEPEEENPMLGFRGASRYYDPKYRDAFALECQAMKRVRDEMGLTNVKLMIPFCRTPEEGKLVIEEMRKNELVQGANELEVYMMCEIPSNVILAEEFAQIFDGFSIGSNDLTQLILGVDRDSALVAKIFDERNPAVKKAIASVIKTARMTHRKIGICGQAPSDYPDFARFLVDQGIHSISLNPDAVVNTTVLVAAKES